MDIALKSLKSKKDIDKKASDNAKKNDKNSWDVSNSNAEPRGIWYTLKWTLPCLWVGGFWIKIQVVTTLFLIVLSKVLSVRFLNPLGSTSFSTKGRDR